LEQIPINILDLGIIVFLFIGAIIGLILGFVRGGLFVVSWLGSAVTTMLTFDEIRPTAKKYIENPLIADLACGFGVFIITLIILFLASSLISSWVRNSRLNALDRSLGMIAGIFTTGLILVLSFNISGVFWPTSEKQPIWITESRSLILLQKGSDALNKLLPYNFQMLTSRTITDGTSKTKRLLEKKAFDLLVQPNDKNLNVQDRDGYNKKERKGIENLLNKTD
jgi:uncharacterized membrane protein required for colicin V production